MGSGFAGSLMARVLAVQGYDVVLLERGAHPRFAIGESSTPLANLSLERLGTRYGMADWMYAWICAAVVRVAPGPIAPEINALSRSPNR